jgi:Rieske Fe-S protein
MSIINASVAGNTIRLTIHGSSPLAGVGNAALAGFSRELPGGADLTESFNAMTAVCTHEGCTVSGYENQTFVCPCHGSGYNTNGSAVRGRPRRRCGSSRAGSTATC